MSFQFTKTGKSINLQAEKALAITATDTTATIYEPGVLYVGVAGTVALIPYGASAATNSTRVVFPGVPAGTVLPVLTQRVTATDTTARGFVILY
jgi:hypothetical protein